MYLILIIFLSEITEFQFTYLIPYGIIIFNPRTWMCMYLTSVCFSTLNGKINGGLLVPDDGHLLAPEELGGLSFVELRVAHAVQDFALEDLLALVCREDGHPRHVSVLPDADHQQLERIPLH